MLIYLSLLIFQIPQVLSECNQVCKLLNGSVNCLHSSKDTIQKIPESIPTHPNHIICNTECAEKCKNLADNVLISCLDSCGCGNQGTETDLCIPKCLHFCEGLNSTDNCFDFCAENFCVRPIAAYYEEEEQDWQIWVIVAAVIIGVWIFWFIYMRTCRKNRCCCGYQERRESLADYIPLR